MHQAVAENINRKGRHVCDIKKSSWYNTDEDFQNAYDWLAKALARRVKKPADAAYPIWAYHELDEDYDYSRDGSEGEECVFFELEKSDNQVVAIDPVKWFDVIVCGFVCPPGIDEEEYDSLRKKYDNATEEELNANREQIFDVDEDNIPEIIFWAIDANDVVSATRYTCHLSTESE